jgi:diguanylate cyclase (GGDEF)-like protein
LAASVRSGRDGAILFIDLDNFKTLNDTLGHDVGDLLLQQVAERLISCLRANDTIAHLARLGGDEFVVMLEDLSELAIEAATSAKNVGNKILKTLNQPYQLVNHEYQTSVSIGLALFSDNYQTQEDLLKHADIAMYQAKKDGRNTIRLFDPQMQTSINLRAALEADLRIALKEKQFTLYYQPQVYHNRQIIGAEVLLRWQHPKRGLVSPLDFIPLAEQTGLILPIGLWVLETACYQLKTWEANTHTQHLHLSVNVSARQFYQADFVAQVSRILRQSAINPDRLKLELTESLVLDDVTDTIFKMNALREIGVRFSMDDFGTGHSSLSYLTQLPLDQLKIDQSFIRNIGIKPTDSVIVQTIIGMGNNLGIDIIAEGVETELQRQFIQLQGCPIYQGYLFSKPVPLEVFEVILMQG